MSSIKVLNQPNSGVVVECKSECDYFGDLYEGFVSSKYLLEPLYVVICVTKTEEARY